MFNKKRTNVTIGSNISISDNECIVNGKRIVIPPGVNSVVVKNNKLYLDGKLYDGDDMKNVQIVTVVIEGGAETVHSDKDVVINGNATEVHAMRDVDCTGDITAATAGRDIDCGGKITTAKAGRDISY